MRSFRRWGMALVVTGAISLASIVATSAAAQTESCEPVAQRAGRQFGCVITAREELGALPKDSALYWHIDAGRTKFAIVAAASFGLFPLYWFWRQWEAERQATGENFAPPWRAIFSGFFAYGLFKRVAGRLETEGLAPAFRPGLLAATYLFLSIAWRLPSPWWLLALGSFLPVYPVQADINRAIRAADPEADLNEHWSPVTFLLISAGVAFTLLAGIGAFMPETP